MSSISALHETCIGARFDHLKIIWEIRESLCSRSRVFPRLVIGQKWVSRGQQICRCDYGLCFVSRNISPRDCRTGRNPRGHLSTHICNCSVNAALIDGNYCAKNQFNSLWVTTEVCGQFSTSFAHQSSKALDPRNTGCPLSLKSSKHVFSDITPLSIRIARLFRTTSFLIQAQEMTNDRARIFLHVLPKAWNSQHIILCSMYIDMKMIRRGKCTGSHCISIIILVNVQTLRRLQGNHHCLQAKHLAI